MNILLSLIQAMAVFFVFFHLYTRSPAFNAGAWLEGRVKLGLYVFFTLIAVLGSYLGTELPGGVIANTRAVGAILAGLVGGPVLGFSVGFTAGLHRLTLGGITATAGCVATTLEGIIGGVVHRVLVGRGRADRLTDWRVAGLTAAVGEVIHMGIVLALSRPFDAAVDSVQVIGLPMIAANSFGVALFMTMLRDRQRIDDKVGAASSAWALKIADRTLGLFARGFGPEMAREVAEFIREGTGVAAVAVSDREKVLAFVGAGEDHHRAGGPLVSPFTKRAIADGEVVFVDGVHERFRCPISSACPLSSVLVAPLQLDDVVIGTVQLYEPRHKRFGGMNKSLGEGIAALVSSQLVLARYQEQKNLLVTSELKLIQAQVNPHFLFNALNTIIAILRRDPDRARELLIHLSTFFRKNLKRSSELSTLREELEHAGSYLEIEKARFEGRVKVEVDVEPELLGLRVPAFTLQPLIENAFKHGLSATLGEGTASIRAFRREGAALIEVVDTAGAWRDEARESTTGLGLKIVDKRIKNLLGPEYGVKVTCVPGEETRVTVRLPVEGVTP